jgi:hypothetical protein
MFTWPQGVEARRGPATAAAPQGAAFGVSHRVPGRKRYPLLSIRCGYKACFSLTNSATFSPITTQGAMVFPVVTRGMIEPSAIRASA